MVQGLAKDVSGHGAWRPELEARAWEPFGADSRCSISGCTDAGNWMSWVARVLRRRLRADGMDIGSGPAAGRVCRPVGALVSTGQRPEPVILRSMSAEWGRRDQPGGTQDRQAQLDQREVAVAEGEARLAQREELHLQGSRPSPLCSWLSGGVAPVTAAYAAARTGCALPGGTPALQGACSEPAGGGGVARAGERGTGGKGEAAHEGAPEVSGRYGERA